MLLTRTLLRHRHRRLSALCAGLLLGLGLAGCAEETRGAMQDSEVGGAPPRGHGGRGVLVIAIDSLRADHTTPSGYDRNTTPALAGLVAEGAALVQTFSTGPEMTSSHTALLTGCDPVIGRQPLPDDAGAFSPSRRWLIPDQTPSLAAEYLAAGYATACFVDHSWLAPELGFYRGFERYDEFEGGLEVDENDFGAAQLGRRVLNWIRSLDRDRDWFAYVQVSDLERSLRHEEERRTNFFEARPELTEVPPVVEADRAFFAIPRRLWSGGPRTVGEYEAAYDEYLRRLDSKLGRLFARLDALGLDDLTICVVGTYGMGFGESGLYLDHGTLSDVDLHVPLVIRFPRSSQLPRGQLARGLASTLDVAPTLLELSGIERPSGMHGVSQVPALSLPDGPPVREVCFSTGGVSSGFAVHDRRYSYQSTVHAIRGDADLVASWYGTPYPAKRDRRRHMRDRESGAGPGDLEQSSPNLERADELQKLGDAWYSWMERTRLALHNPPWVTRPTSERELAELRRRGLIPEPEPER